MSALEIEAWLYELLNAPNLAVYNHVPDDAVTPFLRIGEITVTPWLIEPTSAITTLMLTIFSDEPSNYEAIEVGRDVRELIMENLTRASFEGLIDVSCPATRIFQLKNLTWCADIELKVRHYIYEEPKCTTQK